MSTTLTLVPREGWVRRDKRGRRIGYNWWREYNCSLLLDARLVWERDCEAACNGHATEIAEYASINPRPTLKSFLLANAGMYREPEQLPA